MSLSITYCEWYGLAMALYVYWFVYKGQIIPLSDFMHRELWWNNWQTPYPKHHLTYEVDISAIQYPDHM